MINNLNKIKDFLEYSEGSFYVMYVHKRPKDFGYEEQHPFPVCGVHRLSVFDGENHENDIFFEEILMIGYIYTKSDFDKCAKKMKKCASENNARIYITTYRINEKMFFDGISMSKEDFLGLETIEQVSYLFKEYLGNAVDYSFKMTDVDEHFRDRINEILYDIKCFTNCFDDSRVFAIETPNGYHVISPHFSTYRIRNKYYGIYSSPIASVMLYSNF